MQEALQGRQEITRKRQAPQDRTTGANDGNLGNRIKVPRFLTLGRNTVGVPLPSTHLCLHGNSQCHSSTQRPCSQHTVAASDIGRQQPLNRQSLLSNTALLPGTNQQLQGTSNSIPPSLHHEQVPSDGKPTTTTVTPRSQQQNKGKRKMTVETASPPQTGQEDRSLLNDVWGTLKGARRALLQLQQEKTKLKQDSNSLTKRAAFLEQQKKALEEEKKEQVCKIAQLIKCLAEQRESISQGQLALTNQQLFTEIDRTEMHTKYRRKKKMCQQMRRAAKKWKRRTSRLAEKKEELQETLDQTRQNYVALCGLAQKLVRTRPELERQKAQFGRLQEQHNRQTQQCRLQTATITRLHSEKLSLEGDLCAVKAQKDQLEAESTFDKDQIRQLSAEVGKVALQDNLILAQEEVARLKTALEDCKRDHAREMQGKQVQLSSKQQELQQANRRNEILDLEKSRDQACTKKLEEEVADLETKLLAEKNENDCQARKLTKEANDNTLLEGDLRAVKAQKDQLEVESTFDKDQNRRLSAEVQDANEEKVTLRGKLSQAQKEEVRLKTALEDGKGEHAREMEGKQVQLNSKEQELHRADKRNKSLDLENCRNQAAMEELEREVADLETQLFDEKNQTASQARMLTKEANDKTLLKGAHDSFKKMLEECSEKLNKSELESLKLKQSLTVTEDEKNRQYGQIQFLQEQNENLHQQNGKVKQRLDDSDRSLSIEADRVRSQATEAQSNHANNMRAL